MQTEVRTETYRFGAYELDVAAHQLSVRGEPVRLERRPFELLVLLVSRQGRLVSREEIIAQLWPGKVIIDFDTGLNTLVRKVRQALGDSPDAPDFIETVAGLGYRFIAAVSQPGPQSAASEISHEAPLRRRSRWDRRKILAGALVLVVAAVAFESWYLANTNSTAISIAVLPFENLTGSAEYDYLAAGLAEDTSASMAQIDLSDFRMIGRVSGQAYAASRKSLPQIGREMGVDFVVASSLRVEQSRVRVTSQLVRVADNEQLWSASFDRELTNILGLQRELSVAIAEQVRLRLSRDVTAAMANRQTQNPEAYDLYLRGRYFWSQLNPAANRQALEYFERAIRTDPNYALAWAGIAQVLSTAPITGDVEPAQVTARARDAVQKAAQFGADLTEVQYALGYFNFFLAWNWPAAEVALRRAITLDPNNAIAHLMLGHVLSQMGNQVEARVMMRRARELDPFFSHTFAMSSQVAFQARDYNSAVEFARQAIAINPEGWIGYLVLAQAQAALGKTVDALNAYDTAGRFSGGNSKTIAFRGHLLAITGRADEARTAINELQVKAQHRYVPPYATAIIHAGLAEHDAAFEWLERSDGAGDVHLVFLTVDPRWDPLRDDPRFQSLLERCGFVTASDSTL